MISSDRQEHLPRPPWRNSLNAEGRLRGLADPDLNAAGLGQAKSLASANTVAAVAFVGAGAAGLAGRTDRIDLGALGGLGPASLRVDALSGLFLVISFGVAIPALAAASAPANRASPRLPAAVAVVLAAVVVIVTADNFFVLLFGWEALTVAFYLLAGYDRGQPGRAEASVVTVVCGKASGARAVGRCAAARVPHAHLRVHR
jgi:formate hydrogenlyase subunit 3/multisubunit Na+/H+ antiporter MnhD subunit